MKNKFAKIDSISNGFATCANQITIKLWSEAPYKAAPFKEIAGLTSFNSILYLKDQNVLLCGGNFNIYVYSMVSYQFICIIHHIDCEKIKEVFIKWIMNIL